MININEDSYKVVEDFKEKANKYLSGELDPIRFKAFRVSMGVYEQRTSETYMVRTRIPGGVITLKQFQCINDISKKYAAGKIRFTSRQDIQFQNIQLPDVYKIMKELIEVGIITKGTGGNTVRNVECSPLSGVSFDDIFDVTPFVREVTNYLLKDPSTMNLPRKYKIGFSNSPQDTANATISDLGFITKIVNGKKGFEVYGGGGFGGNPKVSIKLKDFIETKDVIYYVQAMKELFEREGDRSNKHKARIRYIVERLGEEKFIQLFNEELKRIKEGKDLDLIIDNKLAEETTKNTDFTKISKNYESVLFNQKQAGYNSVYVHPQGGTLQAENLQNILEFVNKLNYKISIRLTNTQGFFVRDLKEEDAKKLLEITGEFSSKFDIYNSVTCAGASTCQLGLCLSQNLLKAIVEEFEKCCTEIKTSLPRIFISGCPNSCGRHQMGEIGLSGRAKRTDDGLMPAYSVSFGGSVGHGVAKMGEVFGDISAKKLPKYLVELAALKNTSGYECFEEFLKNSEKDIRVLTNKYGIVETLKENADLYYDLGASEKFSIEGRGPGECSTGVFDVMKLDLSNAESDLLKFKEGKKSKNLYQAAVSATRTLLILNGIDTAKDREIFKQFNISFIETGYVKKDILNLFDILIDYKLGDVLDITSSALEVEYLYNKVKAMYDSLNGKLEITLPKEVTLETLEEVSKSSDFEIIDFRGVKCPINFVKVKIQLSKIKSGEKRGFYLDDGDPIKNVPLSAEKEGNKIISIYNNYDGYNLLVLEKK
ncbi:MAG TPA: sulfurtransferase TusA family protein [Clostridium sp.]|uniref:sulfurtransferase TusA family protein n=1 Tax=Clostridium sp. TaxID=1506 RepID=UPI002F931513